MPKRMRDRIHRRDREAALKIGERRGLGDDAGGDSLEADLDDAFARMRRR
ncbi:MAG: hypothetical protein R2939_04060 [Kofleriaceae bacterium]